MDEATRGLATPYLCDVWDPMQPWHRAVDLDARLFPERGGGRIIRHPYLEPVVYPQLPDRTFNHGRAPVPAVRSVITRTLGGSVVTKFLDNISDVVIEEAWLAETASTYSDFYWHLHRFWTTPLPPGEWVAWQPRDLTPRTYFVEILDVVLGRADAALAEEIGQRRPWLLREQLTLRMKLAARSRTPSGVMSMQGV